MCVACSSDSVVEQIKPIPSTDSTDPIGFTGADESVFTQSAATRATMLNSGFIVSTFKHFGAFDWNSYSDRYTVMDRFSVEYKENRDDWNGVVVSNWNYVDVTNLWTNKRQEEKFWDYSGFPYRFHAVAPANGNTINKSQITKLGNDALELSATYQAQTFSAPASADAK